MKKKFWLIGAGLLFLTACGAPDTTSGANQETSSSEDALTEESTTPAVTNDQTIFRGTLQTDVTFDSDATLVYLTDIKAIEDPDKIVPSLQTDGVGIYLEKSEIDQVDDWKQGREVEVTLTGLAIMTKSIPPQIPGDSVTSVTLVP